MTKFKGFIFDIDGTLTSTNELIFASFNHVTKKYLGRTYNDKEIIALFGPTEDVILKKWMGENYDKAREDYYDFYEKNHIRMADIFPGIEEILGAIKSKNLPLGIFTGKGRQSSVISLKALGIYDYFDLIITGDDVANHKPSPEGIIKFVNYFSLNPDSVLMIGDAPADVTAAKEAGVKVAAVLWDSYAKNKVLEMESDFIFHNTEELKDFIFANLAS
jgi:pyrophosphatase PpaX